MNFFSGLRKAKSAADYGELIPKLTADLDRAKANLAELKAKRETVLFEGTEQDLAKLQRDIGAAVELIETLEVSIEGAERRKLEAEAVERSAVIEARAQAARQLSAEERRLLKEWHKAATRLAELTGAVDQVQRRIATENAFFAAEGRPDLKLPSVAAELLEKHRAAFEAYYLHADVRPNYTAPDTTVLKVGDVVHLPGYWPAPRFEPAAKRSILGPILQHLT